MRSFAGLVVVGYLIALGYLWFYRRGLGKTMLAILTSHGYPPPKIPFIRMGHANDDYYIYREFRNRDLHSQYPDIYEKYRRTRFFEIYGMVVAFVAFWVFVFHR